MSINARKKLLGEKLPHEEAPPPVVDKAAEPVEPPVDVDALSERIETQAREIEYLQCELEERSAELQRLLSVVEDRGNTHYREAIEQGKADGLKLYQEKLEKLGEDCNRGVYALREFLSETVEKDRLFLKENLAETVSIALAKIIGEVKINPNYLSDKICQIIEEINPRRKAEIQIGGSLYESLKESQLVFERVSQLGNIRCNSDMHPFDLLIETEDEVVDAGYCTQVRKLHAMISEFMALGLCSQS